jgi:hypothetical protein
MTGVGLTCLHLDGLAHDAVLNAQDGLDVLRSLALFVDELNHVSHLLQRQLRVLIVRMVVRRVG